ncbi:hypothetical protein [Actinospongicola halichondriae]|uniref:hypothetical protein n=1 Tax=Actinospongicola halichondriae TaxID=3236844 RepID=UPI003D59B9D0
MTGSIVDDVLAGRRFPYSRAFARAGFSAADAEQWRRAGWHDPDEAAPWHAIDTAAGPETLLSLANDGFDPETVDRVSRFVPTLTAAWTRALLPVATMDVELDLRDRVLANLHRDARLRHPASWSEEQLT